MQEEFEPYWCAVQTLVLQDNDLSDAAFRLYSLYQIKITVGGWVGIDEKKAANWLGWSLQKLRKAKKELIEKNWLIPFTIKSGKEAVFTQPKFAEYCNKIEEEYEERTGQPVPISWWDEYEPIMKLKM